MVKRIMYFLLILSLAVAWPLQAAVQSNEPAPEFSLTDTHGNKHSLSDYKGKYVVLEWVNYECPFVKKHYQSGNMQSIQKGLTDKDVVWLSINSSAEGKQGYYSPEAINEIMENAEASPTAYLLDTDGEVGKTYGAKTTPHMYIINPEGVLIYQGAIDDKSGFDPVEIETAKNYVTTALNAVMNGEQIAVASTTPYGCSVKY